MTAETSATPMKKTVGRAMVWADAKEHGLSQSEFQKLVDGLGRPPTRTELGVASVMWSEHCSYKSSRVHLRTLPTKGERVLQGPGENAGVVDIGDNQAIVFKMESHNHPSFIEPYQGAATGVGGICRDVFTMGARPIAIADCLRFGDPAHEKTAHLVQGVVAGVGGYGNSLGVANVAGDVCFDASYNGNILVNAFCLGVAAADRIFLGVASGVGNPVMYVGAKTGRDGIHGATMASAEFSAGSEDQRPAVQVGDPFMEKLLLEACLELMAADLVVGIQDMGAAGLTSSSVEMAARAGSGVRLDLDNVPTRETGMTPYEIMLSESQERMLLVVARGAEDKARQIFAKWDLDAKVIGEVTDTGRVVVEMAGQVVADLPADLLADGLSYDRPQKQPTYIEAIRKRPLPVAFRDAGGYQKALTTLLSSPSVGSKRWVYEQYDHNVRHGTVIRPGDADSGVVRVFTPDGKKQKGIAITAGCNSRLVFMDPYEGSKRVVLEAYANVSCVGATPLAVTDCLNFGNPEKPEIMWQFAESVRGLGQGCESLQTPIVSGNVSLYNETEGQAIRPTPMIAMVGLLEDVAKAQTMAFKAPGQRIAIVGSVLGELVGTEYAEYFHKQLAGELPVADLAQCKVVCDAVRNAVYDGALLSAHDISEGGFLCAIVECCQRRDAKPLGVSLPLADRVSSAEECESLLFGEGPARFVVSYPAADEASIVGRFDSQGVAITPVGTTTEGSLSVDLGSFGSIQSTAEELTNLWHTAFDNALV